MQASKQANLEHESQPDPESQNSPWIYYLPIQPTSPLGKQMVVYWVLFVRLDASQCLATYHKVVAIFTRIETWFGWHLGMQGRGIY